MHAIVTFCVHNSLVIHCSQTTLTPASAENMELITVSQYMSGRYHITAVLSFPSPTQHFLRHLILRYWMSSICCQGVGFDVKQHLWMLQELLGTRDQV